MGFFEWLARKLICNAKPSNGSAMLCHLRRGHSGRHRSGVWTWPNGD